METMLKNPGKKENGEESSSAKTLKDNGKASIRKYIFAKCRNIYHMSPNSLNIIFNPIRKLYKYFTSNVTGLWLIKGIEKHSGRELSIIYAGPVVDRNYFTNLIYDNNFEMNYCGKKLLPGVIKKVKENKYNCSLAIVTVPRSRGSLANQVNSFYIPCWVAGSFDIEKDKSIIFCNKNSRLTSDLSKIRKNVLSYEVTRDPEQLENFYFNMFELYINMVYGDRKVFSDYNHVKREFVKQGVFKDLLLVKKNNEYIGGALLNYHDKWARISLLGIKDADLNYVKDGVVGAIYYYSVKYFEEKGFKTISLGSSRPFLKDGVIQYKKKWKQKISHYKDYGFLVKTLRETEASKEFFINNPFIFEDDSGLNAAVFVNDANDLRDEDIEEFYKKYYQIGILKIFYYPFSKSKDVTGYSVPPHLSDMIVVKEINNI